MKTITTIALGLIATAVGSCAIPALAVPSAPPVATFAKSTSVPAQQAGFQTTLAGLFTVQNNPPNPPATQLPRNGDPGNGGPGNNPWQGFNGNNLRQGGAGGMNTTLMSIANDGDIYILRGNTLYKISPDMKIVGQVTLPTPQPMFGPDQRGLRGGNGEGGAGNPGGAPNQNGQAPPPPPIERD